MWGWAEGQAVACDAIIACRPGQWHQMCVQRCTQATIHHFRQLLPFGSRLSVRSVKLAPHPGIAGQLQTAADRPDTAIVWQPQSVAKARN
jgi:hypothetical protein